MSIHRLANRIRPQRRQRGFTIIELMLTLIVLVILVAIGAPSMRGSIIRNRLVGQSSDLAGDLQLARNEAFRRQQHVVMCAANTSYTACASDWTVGWIVYVDSNRDAQYTTGEEILRVHQALPTGIAVTVTPTDVRAYYRTTGMPDATRSFTICQTGYLGRVVSISVTGRTSVAATPNVC